MNPPTTATSYRGKLDKLRLLVARAIICNQVNRDSKSSDIRPEHALLELSDQYSLKLFINWLATRYGFPTHPAHIDLEPRTTQEHSRCDLENWFTFAGRYPFYTEAISIDIDAISDRVFSYCDENFEPNLTIVGSLYMRMISQPLMLTSKGDVNLLKTKGARLRGEFYTPQWLVEYCLSQSQLATKPLSILDPACGTGNFLLGAVQMVQDRQGDAIAFVRDMVHGSDIDSRALAIAHVLLALSLTRELAAQFDQNGAEQFQLLLQDLMENIRSNVRCTDALLISHAAKQFDLVVTNPPYISYGSRNQTPLLESQSKYLRHTYPASSEYKIRVHSIFQELAINNAAPHGEIVLLVPDAFLTGAYYEKLRKLINEQTTIIGLSELPEMTFNDATAGRWCVAHYRKEPPSNSQVRLVSFDEVWQRREFLLTQAELVSADKYRFQLIFSNADKSLIAQMAKYPQVRSKFRGHTGIRARHGQSGIVSPEQKGPSWKRGITSGACVSAHQVTWQQEWIDITAERLYAGGFNPNIVEHPKVMVRQTADRLIGALDNDGLYHLNNVHSFAPNANAKSYELLCLTALMNSKLWLYLYQMKSRERKRALAQIDIEMVEALPLPDLDGKSGMQLAEMAKALSNAKTNATLSSTIDSAIYKIYALSAAEIEHIEATVSSPNIATKSQT